MRKKFIFLLLSASLFLTACNLAPKKEDKTVESSSNKVEQSQSSSDDKTKADSPEEKKTAPFDQVNKFDNTKSSKGVLDDKGIYRYDFLNKDDAVYDAMSYQEIKDILPVHEQKPIDVTLATNFTIAGHNFNFKDLTVDKLSNLLIGQDYSNRFTEISGGASGNGHIKLPDSNIEIYFNSINQERRKNLIGNTLITAISVSNDNFYNTGEKEDFGEKVAYEGINLNITRNQFLEKVKIKNPILEGQSFNKGKEFKKDASRTEISYFLQKRDLKIPKSNDSFVKFTFNNDILQSIDVVADPSYLGISTE